MKSILPALAVSAVLVSVASAQSASENALSGLWSCTAEGNGMAATSATTYLAGGKETFDMSIKGDMAGTEFEFTGNGAADWKFEADGKLVETITDFNIKTAKMAGQEVPAADMQAMIAGMIIGQVSTSTVEIKDKTMTLTDQNGTVSACKQ